MVYLWYIIYTSGYICMFLAYCLSLLLPYLRLAHVYCLSDLRYVTLAYFALAYELGLLVVL